MGHYLQDALDAMAYDQRIVIVLKHLMLLLPYRKSPLFSIFLKKP